MDESSNLKGNGVGIILEDPSDLVLEYYWCFNFQASNNCMAGILDEVIEKDHIREFSANKFFSRRFNIKVRQRGCHKRDMVLKKVDDPEKKGKLAPNWEVHFCIRQKLNNGAYKLESLKDVEIPRACNVTNLKFYFR